MSKWVDYNPKKKRGKYLIKFLSEEYLFKFLNTGEIWFSRADQFGDKMECVTIDDIQKDNFPFQSIIERKNKHLISCWHNADSESIAMWDTSFKSIKERRVFALKFDCAKLIEYIRNGKTDLKMSEKKYGNAVYQNIIQDCATLEDLRIRRCAFRKEQAFKYEQEFRFVMKMDKAFDSTGVGLYIGEPELIDFSIMINPLLDKQSFINLNIIIKKNNIGKVRLVDSDLVKWLKPTEW